MVSRRKFITNIALGGAALSIISPMSCLAGSNNKLKKIGFISGILGKNFEASDWKTVLNRAVELGFTEYEGGLKGDSETEFLEYCNEIGLKPIAGGIGMTEDMDKVQEGFDRLNALQMKYAVNYWPWLTEKPFKLDACKQSAEILNRMGELARKNGLIFCWHNHDNEFFEMEEGNPFDYLMDHTEKDLVSCEMDIYWVTKGGGNPIDVLKKYGERIKILHVKDMAPGDEKTFACPGSGIIDFSAVFAEAMQHGIEHYIVEQDDCPDGLACLESSGKYLQDLRF